MITSTGISVFSASFDCQRIIQKGYLNQKSTLPQGPCSRSDFSPHRLDLEEVRYMNLSPIYTGLDSPRAGAMAAWQIFTKYFLNELINIDDNRK
jgi:hypothetical protein